MKKLLFTIFITIFYTNVLHAAQGTVTGNIQLIRSHNINIVGSTDWVTIAGVTSAGTCPLVGGSPIFLLTDDERGRRHLSILLAAKFSNTPVIIGYDDLNLKGPLGNCYIRYLDI